MKVYSARGAGTATPWPASAATRARCHGVGASPGTSGHRCRIQQVTSDCPHAPRTYRTSIGRLVADRGRERTGTCTARPPRAAAARLSHRTLRLPGGRATLPPMQTQGHRGQHQIVAGPQPRGVPLHEPAALQGLGLHTQRPDRDRPQELHRDADDGAVPVGQRRLDRAREQGRRGAAVLVVPAPRAAGPGRGPKAVGGAVGLVEGGRPHPRVRPGDAARGPRTDARSRRSGPG